MMIRLWNFRVFTAVALVSIACLGEAQAQPTASVRLTLENQFVASGLVARGEVIASVGNRALGAYNLRLTWDPAIITVWDDPATGPIDGVAGGATAEFADGPIATSAPSGLATGTLTFADINLTSLTGPKGDVSLARITFIALGEQGLSAAIDLSVISLADTQGAAIPASAIGSVAQIIPLCECSGDGVASLLDTFVILGLASGAIDPASPSLPSPDRRRAACDVDGIAGLGPRDGLVCLSVESQSISTEQVRNLLLRPGM